MNAHNAENDAAFAAGWEAAMIFANYPRSYDERDWDSGDVATAYAAWTRPIPPEQKATGTATVPSEAYDETHPDHAAYVQETGRCYADHECPIPPGSGQGASDA